jgi:hypothetical protein
MIRKSLIDNTIAFQTIDHPFGGSIDSIYRKEFSTKSHVSCTGVCPGPSYRATYKTKHYNIQNFQDLSRGGGRRGRK